jgi:CO/xanthine dehydrogenase FAD-binding subunit
MGIRFDLGATIGDDGRTLQELRESHDSVFLATGLWQGKSLRMERGELLDNGLEFLINVQRGIPQSVGERVLVIGGGSVAADVAITARRLGAQQVTMACLECEEEMPAVPEDVEQVREEGLHIMNSWGPHRILEQDGRLRGMEMVRCTLVFDEAGRFAPAFDPEVKTVIEADQVLVAIGQAADLSYAGSLLKTERGMIVAGRESQATSLDGVFAGGDVTGGSLTVVHAMADGRSAAASIDAYLTGARAESAASTEGHTRLDVNGDALRVSERVEAPRRAVPDRTLWDEDCATLAREAMAGETIRCANCGCVAVNASDIAPALVALDARIRTTQRTIAAEDLFTAAESRTTVLKADELIEEIEIPAQPPESRQRYLKFRTRNAIDFPIVSVAFCAAVRDGKFHEPKVVLGAVAPVPLRVREVEEFLEGKESSEAVAQEAGALAVLAAQPLVRNKLKVEVVKALLRKAIG